MFRKGNVPQELVIVDSQDALSSEEAIFANMTNDVITHPRYSDTSGFTQRETHPNPGVCSSAELYFGAPYMRAKLVLKS
jgi:hypothetical protein